jgi:hypothetical protein
MNLQEGVRRLLIVLTFGWFLFWIWIAISTRSSGDYGFWLFCFVCAAIPAVAVWWIARGFTGKGSK